MGSLRWACDGLAMGCISASADTDADAGCKQKMRMVVGWLLDGSTLHALCYETFARYIHIYIHTYCLLHTYRLSLTDMPTYRHASTLSPQPPHERNIDSTVNPNQKTPRTPGT